MTDLNQPIEGGVAPYLQVSNAAKAAEFFVAQRIGGLGQGDIKPALARVGALHQKRRAIVVLAAHRNGAAA